MKWNIFTWYLNYQHKIMVLSHLKFQNPSTFDGVMHKNVDQHIFGHFTVLGMVKMLFFMLPRTVNCARNFTVLGNIKRTIFMLPRKVNS